MKGVELSRRLDWAPTENRLARAQQQRRARGQPILDLTVSNPTAVGLGASDDELSAAFAVPGLARYDPAPLGLASAREAVARHWPGLQAGLIALTASSSESYSVLFKVLADPGDAVLVPAPSYPLFEYLARLEGVRPRAYRLAYDGRWHIDWDSVDPQGARAICLVNPNNPTGSFLARGDLARASALAARHGMALIVDEVFADCALAPGPDAVLSVARAEPPVLTFVLGGLSKACGMPQLKLGWIAALPPTDALPALELVLDTYLSVGTPVQLALPRLLEAGARARRRILDRVRANRAHLAAQLGPASPCTLLPTEGGWSAILRVPAIVSDEAWAVRLVEEDGVLVQPGYFFDLELGATLVLSLLSDPGEFREGVARLLARVAAV